MLLVVLSACDAGSSSPSEPTASNHTDLRIVSFVPAATRMIVDLGLGDRLVGVAEHDAAAPREPSGGPLSVVGNYLDIDYERLLTLGPTHVVYPATDSGVPERLRQLTEDSGSSLLLEPYPADIQSVIESVARLARSFGVDAEPLVQELRLMLKRDKLLGEIASEVRRKNGITEPSPAQDPVSVLLAFGVDPVVASGPGSVNDELIRLAGTRNAVGDAAVSAVTLDREALVATAPDVIVLLLPGATLDEAAAKQSWFDGLPLPAVISGRVIALTDPQVLLPSTNLPEVLREIEAAIQGTTTGRVEATP